MAEEGKIRVKVLYFAKARELAKVTNEDWEVGKGQTTADLQGLILAKHSAMEKLFKSCAWALNEEYVDEPKVLQAGDTLAIIPAISGG